MPTPKPETDKKRAGAKPRRARDKGNKEAEPRPVSSSSMRRPGWRWAAIAGAAIIAAAAILHGGAVKPPPPSAPAQKQLTVRTAARIAIQPATPPPRETEQQPQAVTSPPAQTAAGFVQDMGDKAAMLLAGYGRSEAGRSRNEFHDLIRQDFDLERIGHFAFGTAWARATSTQRKEYQKLFAAWTVGKYARILDAIPSKKFTVLSAEPVAGDDTMVQTRIEWPGMGSADFGLLVSDTKGRKRITDVFIERDVSVDLLQREDFSSVIRRQGINGLIDDLRQRVNSDEAEDRSRFAERDPGFSGPTGLGR